MLLLTPNRFYWLMKSGMASFFRSHRKDLFLRVAPWLHAALLAVLHRERPLNTPQGETTKEGPGPGAVKVLYGACHVDSMGETTSVYSEKKEEIG